VWLGRGCTLPATMTNLHIEGLGRGCRRWFAAAGLLLLASCREKEGFAYDEADMLEIVDALNDKEYSAEEGKDFSEYDQPERYRVRFDVKESSKGSKSSIPRPGWVWSMDKACKQRTFTKEARRKPCRSESKLLLEGTMLVLDAYEDVVLEEVDVAGTMFVWHEVLETAYLVFGFEGGYLYFYFDHDELADPYGHYGVIIESDLGEPGWGGAPGLGGASGEP